jgi:hypothetical protein
MNNEIIIEGIITNVEYDNNSEQYFLDFKTDNSQSCLSSFISIDDRIILEDHCIERKIGNKIKIIIE